MLTQEQQTTALAGPCVALAFLCEPEQRQAARDQMQGFSDPAIFHRWMSLFWTLGEPEAFAFLSPEEQQLVSEFNAVYDSIEWTPLATDSFISDTSDEDLARLVPVATKLLHSLRSPGRLTNSMEHQPVADARLTKGSQVALRTTRFLLLLLASWVVMTLTHEMGHIIGGTCCGGLLQSADLLPWHLPYSIFEPDPLPLVTLWAGLLLGILVPMSIAMLLRHTWLWFIANFCVLANGSYIAAAWFSGDRYLDTPKLLEHGASPMTIGIYCLLTIGYGYIGFRRSCLAVLGEPQSAERKESTY